MAKQSVTIDGVKYSSRTEAAKALVAAGKSLSEAAEATGMTYQTVYANTKGADKVNARRMKYRVLALGKKGNRTASEIAKKTGLTVSKVVAMLKKNGIAIVTKDSKSKRNPRQKIVKPENLIEIPEPIDQVQDVQTEEEMLNEIPEDAVAAAQAMADMANDKQ